MIDWIFDHMGIVIIIVTVLTVIGIIVVVLTVPNGGCPKGQSLQFAGWTTGYKGQLTPIYLCERNAP